MGAFAMLLSACTAAASNNAVRYPAFTYGCCTEITAITVWHPGQHLVLHWTAQTATTTDPTPHRVALRLSLTGPFSTVDQLKTAISQGSKPPGTRTIDAAAVNVTDQTGGSPVSELDLPADLPSGYYNLGTETASGGSSAGGAAIIQVLP